MEASSGSPVHYPYTGERMSSQIRAVSLAGGAELELEMDVVADSESSWDHIRQFFVAN